MKSIMNDPLTVAINVWLSNGWTLDHRSDPHAFLSYDFQGPLSPRANRNVRAARAQLTRVEGGVSAELKGKWSTPFWFHHAFNKSFKQMTTVLEALPPQSATPEESSITMKLAEAERLYSSGVITHDEYNTIRQRLINGHVDGS